MVRMKVFVVNSSNLSKDRYEDEEKLPIEDFIAQVGYDNIKNIIMSNAGSILVCYTIFYEDGLPYSPRNESDAPKKKGLFG